MLEREDVYSDTLATCVLYIVHMASHSPILRPSKQSEDLGMRLALSLPLVAD